LAKDSKTKDNPIKLDKIIKSLNGDMLFIEAQASTDELAITTITDIGGSLSNLWRGSKSFYANGIIRNAGIIQVEQLKRLGWHW
jgi:hypothetical protein